MVIRIIKVFIFLITIVCVVCLYKVYINYDMIKEIIKQPPIVFSIRFKDGDKGTFKYNINTGKAEKISDYVFQDLSYSNDYEKIIGVIWEDKFQGLAELDMKQYTFKPIIDLEELNKCAKDIGLDEIKYDMPGVAGIHVPQFYKDGCTFFWKNSGDIICYFNNDGRTESYSLEAYKGTNYNPLYMRQLNNKTVYDEMFSYSSADDRLFIRKIKGVGYEKIKFCYICISNVYKYICKNKCRKRSKKNKRRICKN